MKTTRKTTTKLTTPMDVARFIAENPMDVDSLAGSPGGYCNVADAIRIRGKLVGDTRLVDGALVWISNGNPVPPSCFTDAGLPIPEAQQVAQDAYTARVTAEYRAAREDRVLTAEEKSEMRAAFGDGATVVDVISGQKFTV